MVQTQRSCLERRLSSIMQTEQSVNTGEGGNVWCGGVVEMPGAGFASAWVDPAEPVDARTVSMGELRDTADEARRELPAGLIAAMQEYGQPFTLHVDDASLLQDLEPLKAAGLEMVLQPVLPALRAWEDFMVEQCRDVQARLETTGSDGALDQMLESLGLDRNDQNVKSLLEEIAAGGDGTDGLAAMMGGLVDESDGGDGDGLATLPDLRKGEHVEPAHIAAFAEAAAACFGGRPWERIDPDRMLEIEPAADATAPEGMRCFSLLGHMGEQFGMALYESPAAYQEMTDAMADAERSGEPARILALLEQERWSLLLEPSSEVAGPTLDLWADMDLPVVVLDDGQPRYPLPGAYHAAGVRVPTLPELTHLTRVLRALAAWDGTQAPGEDPESGLRVRPMAAI